MSAEHRSDLGLLFIHGIGRQKQGQTLVAWLDPLCEWMREWLGGTARFATRCGVTHREFAEAFPAMGAEARALLDKARVPREPRSGPRPRDESLRFRVLSGTAEVEAACLTLAGTIADARVVLNAIDCDGQHMSASISVAEAFWQDSFPEPLWKETVDWLLRVVPIIVLLHFGGSVRRHWLKRNAGRVLVLFSGARLLFVIGMLPVVQLLLLVLATVGWVPVPGYRHLLSWVQEMIASVLGDAYIFTSSPTRLAAVVSQARKALDSVSERSRKVIVVAHSQGAAVAYELLSAEGAPGVAGLVTLGSGLKKLHYLRSLRDEHDLPVTYMVNGCLVAAGISAGYLIAAHFGIVPPGFRLFALCMIVLGNATPLIASLLRMETKEIEQWWTSGGDAKWLDVYASHDPVSNGALVDHPLARFESEAVTNEASVLGDHTAYWENADEFIATVGMWISRTANLPVPLHALNNGDDELLKKARVARFWRVWFMRFWTWVGYGAVILLAAAGCGPKLGAAVHVIYRTAGFSNLKLGLAALGVCGYLLRMVTRGLWRLWNKAETNHVFSRERDFNVTVMMAVVCSAPSALAAGFALDWVWSESWYALAALAFFVFNGVVIWRSR